MQTLIFMYTHSTGLSIVIICQKNQKQLDYDKKTYQTKTYRPKLVWCVSFKVIGFNDSYFYVLILDLYKHDGSRVTNTGLGRIVMVHAHSIPIL